MRSVLVPVALLMAAGLQSWQDSVRRPLSDGTTANAEPSSVVLSGEVTVSDKGTYQEHPFDVPPGVTRLDVEFTYTHKEAGTELEIGIFDPQRFRGTSRFSKERFHLAEGHATPSYVPGPIQPGRWRISLGIPSIGADTRASWRAVVRFSKERDRQSGLGPTLKAEAGWYVGDLHAHTLHSDAFGCQDSSGSDARRGCQPWEVVEAARAQGLDFLAITDHNTTSHHADLATLQETLTDVVLLRGQELTTFRGHANVYGTSTVVDFRLGFKGRSMVNVMEDVAHEGALLSINHPARETGDRCTGCGWDAPSTPWDRIEAIEVVNGTVVEGPTAGLPFWYARLNEGHRITGIAGSDDHAARSDRGRIGAPATVLFASELSEAALLDAMRAGRAYVRTRGPDGPLLDVTATMGGRRVPMGGLIHHRGTVDVPLKISVSRASGQVAEIVRNGGLVASLPVSTTEAVLTYTVHLEPEQWVHVRLRDERGITAFSNPIYVRHDDDRAR